MEYFFNLARLSITGSRLIRVVCVCLCAWLCSSQALATEDEYREKLLNEIRSSLSDKNKELAEQLVDIRIEEERKQGKFTLFQEDKKNKTLENNDTTNSVAKERKNTDRKIESLGKIKIEESDSSVKKIRNWYVGISYGPSDMGLYKSSGYEYPSFKKKSTAKKISLGYRYSSNFTFDIFYAKLGNSLFESDSSWYESNQATSYGLTSKYYPFESSIINPYLRFGIQKIKNKQTIVFFDSPDNYFYTTRGQQKIIGLGVDYPVNSFFTFSVEWEKYGKNGTTDMYSSLPKQIEPSVFYLSANYFFF